MTSVFAPVAQFLVKTIPLEGYLIGSIVINLVLVACGHYFEKFWLAFFAALVSAIVICSSMVIVTSLTLEWEVNNLWTMIALFNALLVALAIGIATKIDKKEQKKKNGEKENDEDVY